VPNATLIIENAAAGYEAGNIGYIEYGQALQTSLTVQMNYTQQMAAYNKVVLSINYLTN
jgi:cobalt-zinc-cadmium resistance protein CzcA